MQARGAAEGNSIMMSLIENLLPERFKVLGELGRGGTSIVFRALDTDHDREVAVKVLLKDSEEDRFQREAERLASLSHPNVVSFLEVGHHDGRDFLVMEYLEMGDLTSYVQNLSVIDILRFFIQICDGLAHLHDRGIVHRDIKPANILVDAAGCPKITDLGVARQMERNTRLTQAGTILGTYSYLAPEQILSSSVGPKADLYSLGICLFTSLTGRKPFEAENEFTMLKAHLEETPPSILEFIPEAPESLDRLIQEMLAKDEDDRPRSARAVADMLQESIQELQSRNQEDLQPALEDKIEKLPEDQRSVLLAITYLGKEATFARVCKAAPFSEDKTDRCLEELLKTKLIDSPTDDSFALTFPEETIQTRLTPRLRKLFATRLSDMAENRDLGGEHTVTAQAPPGVALAGTAVLTANARAEEPSESLPESLVEPEPESTKLVEPEPEPEPEPEQLATVSTEETPEVKPNPGNQVGEDDDTIVNLEPPKVPEAEALREQAAKIQKDPVVKAGPRIDSPPPETTSLNEKKTEPASSKAPGNSRWLLISLIMLLLGVGLTAAGQWYWTHSASLLITSEPIGAKVKINGYEKGVTPLKVPQLAPGTQAVELDLEGYQPSTDLVELGFAQRSENHYTLDPLVGKLLLTLEPRDALVTIDGQTYGNISSDITLAEGTHQLKVGKEGYQPYESEIVLSEDVPLEVEVRLKPIVAPIKVSSTPKGAAVTLDGKDKGKTPLTLEKVSYGEHEIALRMGGYDRVLETVKVEGDKPIEVNAKLVELPGAVVVNSDPSGAKLKLNGKPKGETPQTLTGLKSGDYTITLSKDGYQVLEKKVTVKPGEKIEPKLRMSLIPKPQPVAPPSRPSRPYTPPSRPTYQPPPPVYRPAPPSRPGNGGGNPWIVE